MRATTNRDSDPMKYSQIEIAVRKFSAQRSELRTLENRVEKLERKLEQLSRALATK